MSSSDTETIKIETPKEEAEPTKVEKAAKKEKSTKKKTTTKTESKPKKETKKKVSEPKKTKTEKKDSKKKETKKTEKNDDSKSEMTLADWVYEAIASYQTDDKKFVGITSISKYVLQYREKSKQGTVNRLVSTCIDKLVAEKKLKKKKNSVAFAAQTKVPKVPKRTVVNEIPKKEKYHEQFFLIGEGTQ